MHGHCRGSENTYVTDFVRGGLGNWLREVAQERRAERAVPGWLAL
jgi:hypothetical protein